MKINVVEIRKKNNRIDVLFEVSEELRFVFNDIPFFYEYNEDIEDTPDGIAVIPFVTNVLPIVWLFDAELYLDEIDKSFYESLNKIKEGYINMYPDASFQGRVHARKILDLSYDVSEKSTVFFSGGLDAVHTLLRHVEEKPDLITIFGADLTLNDVEGWEQVKTATLKIGKQYDLKNVYIKSSFVAFLKERVLSKRFMSVIHGYWYHQIQHGIGMLGLVAPYVYKHGVQLHYIASSYHSRLKRIECASDPTIDEALEIGSCVVSHDAFGVSRQEKIGDVIAYCQRTNSKISLRVCWAVKDGKNCCRCEKCYRTIAGIIVANDDPIKYGFDIDRKHLKAMKKYMTLQYQCDGVSIDFWRDIQNAFVLNRKVLKKQSKYYKYVSWMGKFDFSDLYSNKIYKKHIYVSRLLSAICRIVPRRVKDFLKLFIKCESNI